MLQGLGRPLVGLTAARGPGSSLQHFWTGRGRLRALAPFPAPARLIVSPAFQRGRKRGGRLRRPGPWARRFRHSCLFPCPPLRQPSLTPPASARATLAVAGGSIGVCQVGVSASRSLLPSSLTPRPAILRLVRPIALSCSRPVLSRLRYSRPVPALPGICPAALTVGPRPSSPAPAFLRHVAPTPEAYLPAPATSIAFPAIHPFRRCFYVP